MNHNAQQREIATAWRRPANAGRPSCARSPSPIPHSPSVRRGFTLIELLVSISIFVVLASLVVSTVTISADRDRIRSSASTLQSYLEGARSRAVSLGHPVGVRLIIDQNGPADATGVQRTVSSVIYVGQKDTYQATIRQMMFETPVGFTVNAAPPPPTLPVAWPTPAGTQANANRWLIVDPTGVDFQQLEARRLLQPGATIRFSDDPTAIMKLVAWEDFNTNGRFDIPPSPPSPPMTNEDVDGDGLFDVLNSITLAPSDNSGPMGVPASAPPLQRMSFGVGTVMAAIGKHPGSQSVGFQFTGTAPPTTFVNEVDSRAIPLLVAPGGQEPRQPAGTSIDRDITIALTPQPLPAQEPQPLAKGVVIDLDGSRIPTSWRPPSGGGGSFSSFMDIMFSPAGNVMGAVAGDGFVHLLVTDVGDAEVALTTPTRPVNQGSPPLAIVPPTAKESRLIVTLYTRTGQVAVHEVDPTDLAPGPPNGIADQPFTFAIRGKEAK